MHDYIMTHPEIVVDALTSMQERQRAAEQERARATVASENANLRHAKGDFVAGNPDGDVTLVEFFDYNCAYCRSATPTIQGLLADDRKLRVIFKEWPIRGEASQAAARVSMAAQKQANFLKFHFALMSQRGEINEAVALQAARDAGLDISLLKKDMASREISERLAATHLLAEKIGLGGTPAYVVGTQIIPGAISEADFKSLISHTRATCGEPAC